MDEGGTMDDHGFSGKAAAELVGITYRQLDYWARTDLVRPSLADAKGSGSAPQYSYRNLLELKVIKTHARRRHQARDRSATCSPTCASTSARTSPRPTS